MSRYINNNLYVFQYIFVFTLWVNFSKIPDSYLCIYICFIVTFMLTVTAIFSQGGTAQYNELLEVRICYVSFLLSAIAALRALHGQCGPPLV